MGLDARQGLLFAGLVSLADPGLAGFELRLRGFPGRRKGRVSLSDGHRQLRRLLFLDRFAQPPLPAGPGLEFRVQLVRPGGELPNRPFEAFQQVEYLADSQVATHSPA